MTVFRAATLRTFFFAFHTGAKELKGNELCVRVRCMTIKLSRAKQITRTRFATVSIKHRFSIFLFSSILGELTNINLPFFLLMLFQQQLTMTIVAKHINYML